MQQDIRRIVFGYGRQWKVACVLAGMALTGAVWAQSVTTPAKPTPPVTGDAAIVAAKAAYDAKNLAAFDQINPTDHVLAPYVEYWRLRVALEGALPKAHEEAVRAFLARWADTPLAAPLQGAWLKALGRTRDWNTFALDYPPAEEDTELTCYGIQYRYQRDGVSAWAAGKALWLTGKSLPEACRTVFDAMLTQGELTTEDVRTRYTLAVETLNASLAKALWQKLPAAQRADERSFARAERQSLKYLSDKPTPKQKGARELMRYALERAARQDIDKARRSWVAIRGQWPKADQEYGNARLAYHAARSLHPEADRFFNEVGSTPLNDAQKLWRARAALRAGDTAAALRAIDALSADMRNEEVWRYWRARCLEATRNASEEVLNQAQALYRQLAEAPTYYGFMARERLGIDKALPVASVIVKPEAIQAFLTQDAVRRLIKLNALEMRPEMLREWGRLVRSLDDSGLSVAARAMQQQGMLDRSIAAADRMTGMNDFALRYPRPFAEAFKNAATAHDVDEDWLYAVARQESRFVPDIVSSAGAIGLMQLMPRTASWVAKKTAMAGYRTDRLNEAAVNADFGAFYLKHCLDQLDGSLALAAAAYNAGPGRARSWRAKTPGDGDIWVESIPFDETRDYVKKVLSNAKVYAQQRGASFSLHETLALISTPPVAGNEATVEEKNRTGDETENRQVAETDSLPTDRHPSVEVARQP